jgi:hypothetical protein
MFATYKLLRECVQFILIMQVWAGRRSQFDTVITRLFIKCSNSFINCRITVVNQRERLRKMPMLNTKNLHGVIMVIFNCAKNGIVVHRRKILFGGWFDLRSNNQLILIFIFNRVEGADRLFPVLNDKKVYNMFQAPGQKYRT